MQAQQKQKICKNCKHCRHEAKQTGMLKYFCRDESYGVNAFHTCMYFEYREGGNR